MMKSTRTTTALVRLCLAMAAVGAIRTDTQESSRLDTSARPRPGGGGPSIERAPSGPVVITDQANSLPARLEMVADAGALEMWFRARNLKTMPHFPSQDEKPPRSKGISKRADGEHEHEQDMVFIRANLRQREQSKRAGNQAAKLAPVAHSPGRSATNKLRTQMDDHSRGPDGYLPGQHNERERDDYGAPYRSPSVASPEPLSHANKPSADLGSAPTTTSKSQFDYLTRLYLDSAMQLETRAHLGETAYLLCRLRPNLQQSDQLQVSWVRNMQILTSGEFRYTSDERFRPSHQAGSGDWLLEIHSVQAADEGDYECQVNSEPRPASVKLRLVVLAANVEIVEAPEVRVDEDEQIKLTCRVEFSSLAQLSAGEGSDGAAATDKSRHDALQSIDAAEEKGEPSRRKHLRRRHLFAGGTTPQIGSSSSSGAGSWQPYIYWYKNNVSLEYNNPRGDVQVQRRDLTSGGLESILRLNRASRADNGTYMCKLLPELNEVRPAQARVLVASSGARPSRMILVRQMLLVVLLLHMLAALELAWR